MRPIHRWETPLPATPEKLQAYLDLGWLRMPGVLPGDPDFLKWSFARGSPQHPGDSSAIEEAPAVRQLLEEEAAGLLYQNKRKRPRRK